jgi:hypothetical protein
MNPAKLADIRIRKVRMLKDPIHREAELMGLKDDDLVIVKVTIEKIDGSPMAYLTDRLKAEEED